MGVSRLIDVVLLDRALANVSGGGSHTFDIPPLVVGADVSVHTLLSGVEISSTSAKLFDTIGR